MRFALKLLFIVVISAGLAGCTVPVQVYLMNQSGDFKNIQVTFRKSPKSNPIYKYDDTLGKMKFDAFERFSKNLEAKPIDSNAFEIMLPPESVLLLERAMNFMSVTYSNIETEKFGSVLNDKGAYIEPFELKKQGVSRYSIWYEFN